MTIDQTEVILAAIDREIAKHKVVLAKKENDWKEDETFALNTMNAIREERLKIAVWKRAAALVRRIAGGGESMIRILRSIGGGR